MFGSIDLVLIMAEAHVEVSPSLVAPLPSHGHVHVQGPLPAQHWFQDPHVEPLALPASSSLGTWG